MTGVRAKARDLLRRRMNDFKPQEAHNWVTSVVDQLWNLFENDLIEEELARRQKQASQKQ